MKVYKVPTTRRVSPTLIRYSAWDYTEDLTQYNFTKELTSSTEQFCSGAMLLLSVGRIIGDK